MPVTPNPGITNISKASKTIPATNNIISKADARFRIYDDPKNNNRAITPAVPGSPHPGVLISAITPKNPISIKYSRYYRIIEKFHHLFSPIFINCDDLCILKIKRLQ